MGEAGYVYFGWTGMIKESANKSYDVMGGMGDLKKKMHITRRATDECF